MMEAYCMKCRKKVSSEVKEENPTKRGTILQKGECPECGTTICKIVSGKKKEE